MREIVLDTETTGLDPFDTPAHRIVEIGAVELWNQVPTGKTYHQYINPERDMPADAFAVHGIGEDFPRGQAPLHRHCAGLRRVHRRSATGDPQCQFRHAVPERGTAMGGLCHAARYASPRYAYDRAAKVSRLARVAGCALPPLRDRQLEPDTARRAARFRDPRRGLPGTDRRPAAGFRLGHDRRQKAEATGGDSDWRPRPRATPLPSRVTDEERAAHAAFVAELGAGRVATRVQRDQDL